ncbi:MAG: hypothetical protein ACK5HY_13185, partial [Parahaliea sp.]
RLWVHLAACRGSLSRIIRSSSGVFWRMDKSREHPAFAWIMQVAPRLYSSCCTKNVHAFALDRGGMSAGDYLDNRHSTGFWPLRSVHLRSLPAPAKEAGKVQRE